MPGRNMQLYVDDIFESYQAIKSFVAGMDYETFQNDRKTYSATIREYIIIGEAISALMVLLEDIP